MDIVDRITTPKRGQQESTPLKDSWNRGTFIGSPPSIINIKDFQEVSRLNVQDTIISVSPNGTNDKLQFTSPGDGLKRGRPRADIIGSLMIEGSKTPSNIRCKMCNRVFPREKSLQAHMRTHTGERPYQCDYPGCGKAFCQSGQLKTHQRLHTGEKPFVCSSPGCTARFTHANRHCQEHPNALLKRSVQISLPSDAEPEENNQAVKKWLEKQQQKRQEREPQRKLKKRSLTQDIENEAKKQRKSETCEPSNHSPAILDQQEKLLGAIALMELANSGCCHI